MLHLPQRTLYNRKIPKNKFYEKLDANSKLKELFINQVDYIIWKHKLSQETTNLEPTEDVQEIQVFELHLKQKELSRAVLENIDKAVPYPILYILIYEDEARFVIAYKQKNQKAENKSMIHSYYESNWQPINEISLHVTNGLNLEAVYENMIKSLMTISAAPDEDLESMIYRQHRIELLKKKFTLLESKMNKEKQFNRKVEMNRELQQIKQELFKLKAI